MKIAEMHTRMLHIRMIEKEIAKRYPEGKMRTPVHLSIGQESAAVGVCSALDSDDLVVSSHRSHAHYLAKGGDLDAFIAELHGKGTGCSGGFGGSMHVVDRSVGFMGSTSIVAGTIPVGVGLAFAKKLRGEPGIVVIFHGDAAIEEGVWHESANFAALHNLPVVFVCENNGYSCYTPLKDRQPRTNFCYLAKSHYLTYRSCNGDVEGIYNLMKEVKKYTPAFLEIKCRRWAQHCGIEMEINGRDEISNITDLHFQKIINIAFDKAESAPWPTDMSMLCP